VTTLPNAPEWVWMDGDWVAWSEARIHVSSFVLTAGRALEQRIAFRETPEGPQLFRIADHLGSLLRLGRVHGLLPRALDGRELERATIEAAALACRAAGWVRVVLFEEAELVGGGAIRSRARACVFSHGEAEAGQAPRIEAFFDPRRLASAERELAAPLAERSMLLSVDPSARPEASSMPFFLQAGVLTAPASDWPTLASVARDTVLTLAREAGVEVRTAAISAEQVYLAEEIFVASTSTEILPVVAVDRLPVGAGEPGPLAGRLASELAALASGRAVDRHGWLTKVPRCEAVVV
jgi:branched-chain amino acid aminotransferase